MTVSSTTTKNSYGGDASNVTFAYGFKIFAAADLTVILRSATGTETVQTLTTHYSVTNVGVDTGGNVVFEAAPAAGVTVVIRRNVAQTQTTDYTANDPFPAESHEDALDRLTFIAQQLQEEVDRSFKVSRTNTITSAEFADSAATRASKTLGFDSDGNLTTVADFLPAGGDSAQFTYSTTTTDADPGSGFIRFNHATLSSATIAYIDDNEINGTDVSAWVLSFDDVSSSASNRGRIRMSKSNTLDTWAVWKVSGAATDASGYTKLVLTYIDGAGAFANTDKVFISFVASGEDGAIPGYFYKFATSTTDGDPGAGVLRFNHATYASVTEIYIDDADSNGGATQADTATWGASTSTIKGYLHIVDINDSSTYARFKITAAVDDETGYNKITVVHLASNNTFSADDALSVHFTSVGLKGDTGSTGSTGATGAAGGSAADDISLGDAAVTIATSAGNITIDAQGSDTDIIFKGTDGAADITPLTLDMSDAGKAIFTGAATIGGTLGVTGVPTFTGRSVHSGGITIANAGQIGSVGDADAMAISSSGVVTFSQTPVGAGGRELLLNSTISSAVAVFDINNTYINATYDIYELICMFHPATDGARLENFFFATTDTDASGAIVSGSEHAHANAGFDSATYQAANTADHSDIGAFTIGNAGGEGIAFHMTLYNANNTDMTMVTSGTGSSYATNGAHTGFGFSGGMASPQTHLAHFCRGIRFAFDSGDIALGTVQVFGVR